MMNESPRVGVVGCGPWGKNLVRTFAELRVLVAISDPSEEARAQGAAVAPGARIHTDASDLFSSPDIDAVAIASPAATHAKLATLALTAGKDVMCEKPLALSLADAERVVSLAARRGRVLSVGHLAEYQPAVQRLRALVADGALGEIRFVHAHRTAFGRVRRDEDVLWSFAPHDLAVIVRMLGEPARVTATGWAHLQPGISDIATVELDFDGGCGALVHTSWLGPTRERRLTVIGSERTAVVDEIASTLVLYEGPRERVEAAASMRNSRVVIEGSESGTPVPLPTAMPLTVECADFLRACRTRTAPLADGPSALAVLSVLDAAKRSIETGERVELRALRSVSGRYG